MKPSRSKSRAPSSVLMAPGNTGPGICGSTLTRPLERHWPSSWPHTPSPSIASARHRRVREPPGLENQHRPFFEVGGAREGEPEPRVGQPQGGRLRPGESAEYQQTTTLE